MRRLLKPKTNMAPSLFSAACAALAITSPSAAFAPSAVYSTKYTSTSLSVVTNDGSEMGTTSRRGFIDNMASMSATVAGIFMMPSPAMAYGIKKSNERLAR